MHKIDTMRDSRDNIGTIIYYIVLIFIVYFRFSAYFLKQTRKFERKIIKLTTKISKLVQNQDDVTLNACY